MNENELEMTTEKLSERVTQLKKEAREHYRKAEESFFKSDTDGFLTQWAHHIQAQKKEVQAIIEANGGKAEFPALFVERGGRRVDAKLIHGRYGLTWLLSDDEDERFGRRFFPFDDSHRDKDEVAGAYRRSDIQLDYGLRQKTEWAPAVAYIFSAGTGLSGAASAYVRVKRTDGK